MTAEPRLTSILNPANRPAPVPPKLVNRIALLLDDSGSMMGLKTAAIRYANEQINKIKLAAADSGQVTELSIMTFSIRGGERWLAKHAFPEAAPLVDRRSYTATGENTALYDAVLAAVRELAGRELDSRRASPHVSYLVITMTDGIDNASFNAPEDFTGQLEFRQRHNWSFAFLGPEAMATRLRLAGVPAGNVVVWEQTAAGLEEASRVSSQGIGSYYGARAAGAVKTASFFTELGLVKPKDIQQALEPVTSEFNRIQITKETTIREAVEADGRRFQIGRGYYELTKPEKVQSHKDFVLMERKGTHRLYGGPEARRLLGVPDGGVGVTVKVTPGNHGDWRVFVSSTSTNRKLVRGTTLLYRVS